MTGLDWVIAGAVVLLALLGWANGFLAGVLSLAGFAAGAWLGTRVAPLLLEGGGDDPDAPLVGLVAAVVLGGLLAAILETAGGRLRARLPLPGLAVLDGALGALLTAGVGLGLAWLLAAIALTNGGPDARREIRDSVVLARLNALLPPSGPLLNALARFDPLPRIAGPLVQVAPPRAAIARDPDVARAAPSVVKVLGTACGLGVEGSGWVAASGLVVTNAHVVAGQRETRVLPAGREPARAARVVSFDPRNDLALLRVPALGARALPLAPDPEAGTPAAILGFPLNGPYDVRAGRVGRTARVRTQDALGRGPVERTITSLRGTVRSGNSGGPMVDGRGRVVATIFAATTRGPRGGYGVPNAVVRDALRGAGRRAVSTGPCTG